MRYYDHDPGELQAALTGECRFPHISGQVRFSCMEAGVLMQVHVCGLPGGCPGEQRLFGLSLAEDCHCSRRIRLPILTSYGGKALLSAYLPGFSLRELHAGQLLLTSDPCAGDCEHVLARGQIMPCAQPRCCFPDQRPLFAPPRRSRCDSMLY